MSSLFVVLACEGRPPSECEAGSDIVQSSPNGQVPTGFVECSNGFDHRPERRDCLYPPQIAGSCNGMGTEDDPCHSDADCTERPHGYCNQQISFPGGFIRCACDYGCERDEDCGEGQACYCDGEASRCVIASCRTDGDCDDGYLCAYHGGTLACHTPDDTCRDDEQCTGECSHCVYDRKDEHWQCTPAGNCA